MTETDWLDEQEFYELMLTYRHSPPIDQPAVIAAFEAVKQHIRGKGAPREKRSTVVKYRCSFEKAVLDRLLDVEAESKEEAQRKAAEKLCKELMADPELVAVWPIGPRPIDPAP